MAKPKPKFVRVEAQSGTALHRGSTFIKSGSDYGRDASPNDTPFYINTDKVYFKEGKARPLPGWDYADLTQYAGTPLKGICRSLFVYVDSSGTLHQIYGTEDRLYDGNGGGSPVNITPLAGSPTTIANSLDTVNLSTTVTVNATGHNLTVGDRVGITGAADVGGITASTDINIEHIVTGVPSANEFTITVATAATSTVNGGGGASTAYDKQITVPSGSGLYPQVWSMDIYGDDTLVLTPGQGSKIYEYDGDTSTAPTVLSNAPTNANWVGVSNNAVVALGPGNRIRISSIGTSTTWTPAPGNSAFDDDMENYGRFVAMQRLRNNTFLALTHHRVGLMRYTGNAENPWEEIEDVLESDGLSGARAITTLDGIAYWQGWRGYYKYDGAVSRLPGISVERSIFPLAANSYDSTFAKSFVIPVPELNQLRFWFGEDEDSQGEPETYMIYDIGEPSSTIGFLKRTAGMNQPATTTNSAYQQPLMAGPAYDSGTPAYDWTQSTIYYHERQSGFYRDLPDADKKVIFQYPYGMIGDGDVTMEVTDLMPDFQVFSNTSSKVFSWSVLTKDWPQSTTERTAGPFSVEYDTEIVTGVGAQGRLRSHKIEVDFSSTDYWDFAVGGIRERIQASTPQ